MIHQGSAGFRGSPTDINIQAREVLATRRRMAEILAEHTGHPVEQGEKDIDRDRFMSAGGARELLRDACCSPPEDRLPGELIQRGALIVDQVLKASLDAPVAPPPRLAP